MGFSNERMRTGQLVNWFLLDGLELTPAFFIAKTARTRVILRPQGSGSRAGACRFLIRR